MARRVLTGVTSVSHPHRRVWLRKFAERPGHVPGPGSGTRTQGWDRCPQTVREGEGVRGHQAARRSRLLAQRRETSGLNPDGLGQGPGEGPGYQEKGIHRQTDRQTEAEVSTAPPAASTPRLHPSQLPICLSCPPHPDPASPHPRADPSPFPVLPWESSGLQSASAI